MIWDALFKTTEGWIVIAVTVISVVVAMGIKVFIARKIREDEARAKELDD